MSGTSAPAGSVAIEIVADLSKFTADLRGAEAQAQRTGTVAASGLEKIEVGARKTSGAVDGLSAATKRDADAQDKATAARERATRSCAALGGAADKLAAQWAKLSAMGAAQEKLFQAQERLAAQFRALSAAGAAQARAIGVITDAQNKSARATGLHAHEWTNLGYQVNDVATSLASGASPLMVLAQQGGQVYQILSNAQGGVGGALGAIKDRLLSISPLAGIFGLIAAGAIGATAAAVSYANAQRDVQLALLGVGQGAGVSADQIDLIARRAADSARISVSAAREIEVEFLKTGRVFGEVFERGVVAAENFSRASGQNRTAAATFLSQNLATLGSGGYEQLAKKVDTFDAGLERQVRTLLDAGNEMEAQRLVVERFGQAFDKVGEKLTTLDRITGALSRGFDSVWNSAGRALSRTDKTLAEQLTETDAAIRTRGGVLQAGGIDPESDQTLQRLRERQNKLQAAIRQTGEDTKQVAESTRRNLDVLDKRAVSAAVPDMASLDKVRDGLAQANKTLNALELDGGSAEKIDAAKKAVAGYAAAERDFATAGGPANMERAKANELMKAGLQRMQAVSPEQKAEAERQQAIAETFGTVTSAQERSARANDAYKRSLAESRAASDSASRTMNESTTTANQIAEATAKAGKSVEYLSAARKVDEQIAAGAISAAERETKIREQLQSQLAGVNQQAAERIRGIKEQASVQDSLNAKVAAGTMRAAEAQRQQSNLLEVTRLQREADAASGEQKVVLEQRIRELTSATEAQLSAEDRLRVLGLAEDEQRRIDYLQKEISLLGESVQVRNRELAVMAAKQGLERQGISPDSAESRAYLDKVRLRSDVETIKTETERAAQEMSGLIGGIFDDLFTRAGDGSKNLVENLTRSLARLGSRSVEQGLAGLFSGGGGGQGGLGGGASFDLGKIFDLDKWKSVISEGTSEGTQTGFSDFAKISNLTGSAGKMVMPGLTGGAIGYQTQSPLMGAVGGGISGFATGGPVGGVVGAVAGLIGGIFGKEAKREAEKRRKEQERQEYLSRTVPQIEQLRAGFRGQATTGTEASIRAAYQEFFTAATEAQKVGDAAMEEGLRRDFGTFAMRARVAYQNSFSGVMKDIQAGLGPQGPFGQAAATAQQLGEGLKAFVEDARSIADGGASAGKAYAAAVNGALATIEPPKELSETAQELARIRGTAAGLKGVLIDLGMSADAAAEAIAKRTSRAIKAERERFRDDLGAKVNEAQGFGYRNEVSDLLKERTSLLADAKALGVSGAEVERYFTAQAQSIVNGSQLTGDAFKALVSLFPQLRGRVEEFGEATMTAAEKVAKAAEVASRAQGYGDRLFAANNDVTTLAGQLRAFDRQAERERLEERRAGGEALLDLERAQAAERSKIIRDANREEIEQRRQAAQEAREFLSGISKDITSYVAGLKSGSGSPLAPDARYAEASKQFDAQLALAKTGDRDALSGITGNASALLEASKAFNASSPAYQADFKRVTDALLALPKQVDGAQLIVEAVNKVTEGLIGTDGVLAAVKANDGTAFAKAMNDNFTRLDINNNGKLTLDEFNKAFVGLATKDEQQLAKDYFKAIDANGDSQLTQQELIEASAAGTKTNTGQTKTSVDANKAASDGIKKAVADLQIATNWIKSYSNSIKGFTQNTKDGITGANGTNKILGLLKTANDTSAAQLQLLAGQYEVSSNLPNVFVNGTSYKLQNNMLTALNKIAWNTYLIARGSDTAAGLYASGGYTGPGGVNEPAGIVHRGEIVWSQADIARAGGVGAVEAMRLGMNDNWRGYAEGGPVGRMPAPVVMGTDQGAMLAELRALRAEVARLRADYRTGAQGQIAATTRGAQDVREAVDDHAKLTKRGNEDARQAAARPRTPSAKAA